MRKLLGVGLLVVLGSCSSPSDGPSAGSFLNARQPYTNERVPVVDITYAAQMAQGPGASVSSFVGTPGLAKLRSAGYTGTQISRGDVLQITVLDTGEDGLFSPTNSKTLDLGRFTVDDNGSIDIPFVGKQRVAGSSPEAVQKRIVGSLKGSSVNPQAVVTIVDRPNSAVAVSGAVRAAGRMAMASGKERILDVVARAGGATGPANATTVTVIRGNQRADQSLDQVMADPKQNIYLQPGDQVILGGNTPSFTAMGAFKSAGEFNFEPGQLTLAQAIARSGGLLDDRADSRYVYLFRKRAYYWTTKDCVLVRPSPYGNGTMPPRTNCPEAMASPPPPRAVIFRINMRDASSLLMMQQVQMESGDMLFASNAGMVDFAKLFTVFQKSVPTAAAPQPTGGIPSSPPPAPGVSLNLPSH
ncbi:polysaccharide export protein [Labrys sp. LIt4]|uniref:polysaccharide biosynthesis/export family protein n=1 Tax=Labrys sp. LIt4 TaxID=2821355 RepID=UPI001ADFBFDC|nr:polysaccharide biosynthesis/export family protein [Labrys sp. LIt4]MBP0578245.1 polysaccharide export protein [Labrys sp. LIt4]